MDLLGSGLGREPVSSRDSLQRPDYATGRISTPGRCAVGAIGTLLGNFIGKHARESRNRGGRSWEAEEPKEARTRFGR